MQQCLYETKICDIDDLQKRLLMQTWFDFQQNAIEAAETSGTTVWDRACWWQTLWTHAVKLLFICIVSFIRTFYVTVIVIWCIWRLFRS